MQVIRLEGGRFITGSLGNAFMLAFLLSLSRNRIAWTTFWALGKLL